MRRLFLIIFLLCLASNAGATSLSNAVTVFGTGADGAFTAVNKINAITPTDSDWSKPIIKNYTSFNLPLGTAISPTARNMGIYIYVKGTATIAGNITQTNMCYPSHGYGEGSTLYNLANKGLISPVTGTAYWRKVRGGNGGRGGHAGAVSAYGVGGNGETGNIIGGGFGGGGSAGGVNVGGTHDVNCIDKNGYAAVLGAYGNGGDGTGACSVNGSCTTATTTGNGGAGGKKAGGAIWIIAKKIIINPTAKFYVNATEVGTVGANMGSDCSNSWASGGGGGGGGGFVSLVYKSIIDIGIAYSTGITTQSTPTFYTIGAEGGNGGTDTNSGGNEYAGENGLKGRNGHVYKIDLTNKTFNEYIQ